MSKGRVGKYQEWITEDGLKRIEAWARDGLTEKDIAEKKIGISQRTFDNWKKKYPSIVSSLKKGKAPVDMEVENALLKRALGYEYEEVKTYIDEEDGKRKRKVEKTTKHVPADVTAGIFWLKNRKGGQWNNKDVYDIEKMKADTELLKERAKLLKGVEEGTEHKLKEYFKALESAFHDD